MVQHLNHNESYWLNQIERINYKNKMICQLTVLMDYSTLPHRNAVSFRTLKIHKFHRRAEMVCPFTQLIHTDSYWYKIGTNNYFLHNTIKIQLWLMRNLLQRTSKSRERDWTEILPTLIHRLT